METDIKVRIEKDFGDKSSKAIKLLDDFEHEFDLSPRVSRCIIHLSEGDINKLELNIELAQEDWRDIIDMAEEEQFEFKEPFG
ncbi:MAG: hypothetical protein AAGH46_09215 [Bacteroidota bacterium]